MTSIPHHLMKHPEGDGNRHLLKSKVETTFRHLIKECFKCINCGGHCYSTNSYVLLEWDYQLCVWPHPNIDCSGDISGVPPSSHDIAIVPAGTRLEWLRHDKVAGTCDGNIWVTENKVDVEVSSTTTAACGDKETVSKYVGVMVDCDAHLKWYIGFFDSKLPANIQCNSASWTAHVTILKGVNHKEAEGCGGADEQGDKDACTTTGPLGSERQYELWDIEVKNNKCCKYLAAGDDGAPTDYPNCNGTQTHPDARPHPDEDDTIENCPCSSTISYSGDDQESFDVCGEDGNECTECDNDDCPP